MSNKSAVTIWPSGEIIQMNEKDSLFSQLKENGINIKSTCGGCASCGQCTILITSGEENLNEPSFEEKQLIGNVFHITKERLSCQTYTTGNITIDISAHLELNKERKQVTKRRSREEADSVLEKRKEASKEKRENRKPRAGGIKKPKSFNYSEEDSDKE